MVQSSYFVRLPESELIKLSLLESAKETLLCSKEYYRLVEIRKQKDAVIADLKGQAGELISLMEKLSSALPESEHMLEEFRKASKSSSSSKKKAPSKKKSSSASTKKSSPAKETDLDRLNKALSDIEEKLERLS